MNAESGEEPEIEKSQAAPPPLPPAVARESDEVTAGREAYNVISDTVIGVNVRKKDNLYQGIAILIFAAIGAGICGWIGHRDGHLKEGALLGVVAGLIVGVVSSGAFIMIYRGLKHFRGKHD